MQPVKLLLLDKIICEPMLVIDHILDPDSLGIFLRDLDRFLPRLEPGDRTPKFGEGVPGEATAGSEICDMHTGL